MQSVENKDKYFICRDIVLQCHEVADQFSYEIFLRNFDSYITSLYVS